MKKKYSIFLLLTALLFLSGINSSCSKIKGNSKGHLNFSIDTLVFDTVFTTIGSSTQQFKIYNNENKPVQIDEIELMGGANSPFSINIDGEAKDFIKNITLRKV